MYEIFDYIDALSAGFVILAVLYAFFLLYLLQLAFKVIENWKQVKRFFNSNKFNK